MTPSTAIILNDDVQSALDGVSSDAEILPTTVTVNVVPILQLVCKSIQHLLALLRPINPMVHLCQYIFENLFIRIKVVVLSLRWFISMVILVVIDIICVYYFPNNLVLFIQHHLSITMVSISMNLILIFRIPVILI